MLANCPQILALGVAWPTGSPTREMVEETLSAIDVKVSTIEMFDHVDSAKEYFLRGCICYYGLHYVAFFKVRNAWIQYDDVVVRRVRCNFDS